MTGGKLKNVSRILIAILLILMVPVWVFSADVKNDVSTNLEAYWELEEATGAIRTDSHSTNDLDDTNNVTQDTSGKQGNAADFEESDSEFLSIVNGDQTGLDFTTDFSFSLWVKLEQLPSTLGAEMSLYERATFGGGGGILLRFRSDDTLRIYWEDSSSNTSILDSTSAMVVSGDVGIALPKGATAARRLPREGPLRQDPRSTGGRHDVRDAKEKAPRITPGALP